MSTEAEVHEAEIVVAAPTALQKVPEGLTWNREQISLLKATVARDTTDAELDLFLHVCKRTGLDPFAKQIYAIKRKGKLTIQTSIDGFRLIAERSRRYRGQLGPFFCAKDGAWSELWTDDKPPFAAKIGILREGFDEPLFAIAKWSEFSPADLTGTDAFMWRRMPSHQLGKCAEALGLRRAFPQELGGLYISEEIAAGDREDRAQRLAQPARTMPTLEERTAAALAALREKKTRKGLDQAHDASAALRDELADAGRGMLLDQIENTYSERCRDLPLPTNGEAK